MQTWHDVIGPLKQTDYFQHALAYVAQHRQAGEAIYPPDHDIFNAFKYTPFDHLKAVIVGQDPYHQPGQAMGLSFSVPVGCPVPPSLQNIYRELASDVPGFTVPQHGCLIPWARQGVLLLNSILTVRDSNPLSHRSIGWEQFTDAVIAAINEKAQGVVFLLWGKSARIKGQGIDRRRHLVLEAAHPSPLSASRGFFGCRHFSQANAYLHAQGKSPINWQLPVFLDGSERL